MSYYVFILPIYGIVNEKKPGQSLSMNWYRNAHYQSSNKAKRRFKVKIMPQLERFDEIKGRLSITYKYYAKRNGTDLDNFCGCVQKFFQDALTETGLIVDDNCSVIVENKQRFMGVDKNNPRIEVHITVID